MSFKEFLRAWEGADSIGFLRDWFFTQGGKYRKGREVDGDEMGLFETVIEDKAAKTVKGALHAAWLTAVHGYENAAFKAIAPESSRSESADGWNDEYLPGVELPVDHHTLSCDCREKGCRCMRGDASYGDHDEPEQYIAVRSVVGHLSKSVKTMHEKGTVQSQEIIETLRLDSRAPISEVRVDLKYTKNIGNWESVSATYGVSLPCYMEEMDDAFSFAEEMASDRLEIAIGKLAGESIGLSKGDKDKSESPDVDGPQAGFTGPVQSIDSGSETPGEEEEWSEPEAEPVASDEEEVTFESNFDPNDPDKDFGF